MRVRIPATPGLHDVGGFATFRLGRQRAMSVSNGERNVGTTRPGATIIFLTMTPRKRKTARRRTPPTSPALLLLALCVAMPGCTPRSAPPSPTTLPAGAAAQGSTGAANRGGTGAAAAAWPFWPVSMRVHPLTRLMIDRQTSEQIIECRLEFQDSQGQTSKASGQLTLQIYPESSTPLGGGALQTWNQDLRDLEINHQRYDDVTRTYLFRLQITQPLPAGAELRAFFLSADGRRLSAHARLRQ